MTNDPSDPRHEHVSLASFAAVQAALAEGFELGVVLEREGLEPALWLEAEDAWSDRLTEDLEQDGPLQEAFDQHFAEAQDRLARPVPPLDDDLPSWLDFVRHWASASEPVLFLSRLGLHPSDVIRLHRAWSKRLAEDPALSQRAKEILEREPGPLPAVLPAPRVLDDPATAPSTAPAGPGAPVDAAGEPEVFVDLAAWLAPEPLPPVPAVPPLVVPREVSRIELPDDTLPAACSPIPREPVLPVPVPGELPLAVDLSATGALPSGLLAAALPFMKGPPTPVGAPQVTAPPPVAPEGRSADRLADETLPATLSPIPRGPALPFPPPAVARPPADLHATGTLPSDLLAAALPFMHAEARREPAPGAAPTRSEPAALAPRAAMPPAADLSGTGALPSGILAAALPFMKGRAAPEVSAQLSEPSPVAPAGRGADETLPATLSPIPRGPALPFPPPGAARPPADLHTTGTLPSGLLAAALPFMKGRLDVPASPPVQSAPRPAAAPAQAAQSAARAAPPAFEGTGVQTLAQYAALCAELTMFPAASEQTFVRYGLADVRRRVAVDLAWQERLRRDPGEYAEWQRLYQGHQARLRSGGR
jgi:hypothetical protein